MSELETRVALLEQNSEYHEKEIKRLDNVSRGLDATLSAIQAQLSQIKWIGVGVVLTLIAESFGFVETLKMVFK